MRLATLTQTQQSSPLAEQKQLRRLSAVVVHSTPLFAMTAAYNDVATPAAQLGCSSNVPASVPADCPRDPRDLSVIKAAARDSSAGTRLSCYTAIFVFFPVRLPRLHPAQPLRLRVKFVITQAGSRSWLILEEPYLKVNILSVSATASMCQ